LDFSFSGLKTAVLRTVEKLPKPLPVADLAASFQSAVVKVLVRKTLLAQNERKVDRIVVAGGVAANSALRAHLKNTSKVSVYVPAIDLCTDNAAMVAAAAYFCGVPAQLDVRAYSRR
jgi:N6-L-threonylcarbamoyladenine synthase